MSDFFRGIPRIRYEGPESDNEFAFRHYNPDEVVDGKTMKEHLRFSVAFWHTFRGTGADPFGPGCAVRPWEDGTDSVEMAGRRVRAAFEFMEKLGTPYYCFHDRDVAPEGKSLRETNANLDRVVKVIKEEQERTGIQLLWGTANLFSNKRYVHGAATSPNADAFVFAAAQVKKMLEVTKELGGANYVFWGGREGYSNLYNTDLKRELDHLARFFYMAVDFANPLAATMHEAVEYYGAKAGVRWKDEPRAAASAPLAGKTFEVEGGFLKTIRVAQNQVVPSRVVTDAIRPRYVRPGESRTMELRHESPSCIQLMSAGP